MKDTGSNGQLVCDYCGKKREEISFVIGASLERDWVMMEGTGKVSCPECWEKGKEEARAGLDKLTEMKT